MNLPPIAINDLERHWRSTESHVRPALDRVLGRAWYVLGDECRAFEAAFADFCGAKYCIGVGNGTDALELSLRALQVGRGDRVATVANAGYYASTALTQVGAIPIYVDVDPRSRLMDLAALEGALAADAVTCVIVTHLYGLLHDVRAIRAIAQRHGVPILEDCAQAHGAARDGARAGAAGDIAAFSFYPTKNLGALGDGGAVTTSNEVLAQRVRKLRQYGWAKKYENELAGGRNSRLDELQAAALHAKLPLLSGWNARRREIAHLYLNLIVSDRVLLPQRAGDEHVYHLFVIEADERDSLRTFLSERGIGNEVHYPIPDHLQRTQHLLEAPSLPNTEQLSKRVLTLPCYPEMTDEEVRCVAQAVNDW
jgi:aminotransferase EvaB